MIEIVRDGTGRIHVSKNVIRRLLHFHGARVSCAGRLYVFLDGYKKHLHFVPPPSFQSGPEYVRRGPPRFFFSPCAVALDGLYLPRRPSPRQGWHILVLLQFVAFLYSKQEPDSGALDKSQARARPLESFSSCTVGRSSPVQQVKAPVEPNLPVFLPASIGCIRRWRV